MLGRIQFMLAVLLPLAAPLAAVAQQPLTVVPTNQAEIQLSFAPVVKRAAPAVVNIYTRTRITRQFNDPVFEMFFGRRLGPRTRDETNLGSGVIVREDGIVVTNSHVVKGADEITVALNDRREFEARVLLTDESSDLAVLQVEATDLPALEFRDSDTMEVGDLVLAIGNPFGVGQTVTSGIVSAQTRTSDDGQVFIQTDAAINPGNSGGALVDMSGRLVGINTMILSRSGGSNGIGFAIPANLAQRAVDSAAAGGVTVAKPWLGAKGQPVTQEIAESLGLVRPEGVILSRLHPSSPLTTAGLVEGDIIVRVSGRPVRNLASLRYRYGTGVMGSSVDITYLRSGARHETTALRTPPPDDPPRNTSEISGSNPLSGLVIANINPALAEENGLDPSDEGVAIVEVLSGAGKRYGIRSGDILRSINGTEIARVADVQPALDGADRRWRILIDRGGRTLRLAVSG